VASYVVKFCETERTWPILTYYYGASPDGLKNTKKLLDRQYSSRGSNARPAEYKTAMLATTPLLSFETWRVRAHACVFVIRGT
jgi:hypothetical protein